MAGLIVNACKRVCYSAPGIHEKVAKAVSEASHRLPLSKISVSIDFDERVLRMGYGSLESVQILRDAGIEASNSHGLRVAVLIVDNRGWVFSPTALYLEPEPQSEETPNAIRLASAQIDEIVLRISPEERKVAIVSAESAEERQRIENIPQEIGEQKVTQVEFDLMVDTLQKAPPVKFDVVRQVRVFESYLQYVDLKLSGAAIHRHRIQIPPALLKLGANRDMEGRLRTTFDLIEQKSQVSSKSLEDDLNEIRKNLTRSLGNGFGRVVLKAARKLLDERVEEFKLKLQEFQDEVKGTITEKLQESKDQVIEYYLPAATANLPDQLVGGSLNPKIDEPVVRAWIDKVLTSEFPSAEELVSKMSLEVSFKDVTFETLNNEKFLKCLKVAYPEVDWDRPYNDFRAMGEESTKATEKT